MILINGRRFSLLEIHMAVMLFGLAGLFGKFLLLSASLIVFGRTFFAALALAMTLFMMNRTWRPPKGKELALFFLMGAVLALHWGTFFYSIQVSTVAIGLLAYASFPLFVTFMEPLFFTERLRLFDVLMAMLVFLGLVLVVPTFDFQNNIFQGVFWGVISGFTFAVLALLNRCYVKTQPPLAIAFLQNSFAALLLLPIVVLQWSGLEANQLYWLILLGLFCTALAHVLFIRGLQVVKAQLASLIAGLEPVYGILFALVLLGEVPEWRTMAGGCLILGATLLASLRRS